MNYIMYGTVRVNVCCFSFAVFLFFIKLAVPVHVYFVISNSVASKKQCNIEGRNKQGYYII